LRSEEKCGWIEGLGARQQNEMMVTYSVAGLARFWRDWRENRKFETFANLARFAQAKAPASSCTA
jgi:hypothetical protein